MIKIIIKDLAKSFSSFNSKIEVFNNLNTSFIEGEFVSLIGPSGCGKSTLINLMSGFDIPDKGEILIGGLIVSGPNASRGVIFQEDAIFPWYTVEENISYGLKTQKIGGKTIKEKVKYYIDIFKLNIVKSEYPKSLSGGEKKRVDLARTLINDPDVIFMDEPFASLDSITKEDLQLFTLNLLNASSKTVIYVTHDIEEAIFMSDKIYLLSKKPSHIIKIIDIPFEKPRDITLKYSEELQEIRRKILDEYKTNNK